MIREGHTEVLKYRANFFKTCLEELADYYGGAKEQPEVNDRDNIKWLKGLGV